jgi:hypothetical protein
MVKKKKKPRFKGTDKYKVRHFQNRVRERYGLILSYQDMINIVKMIKSGESECIKKKTNMHTRHRVFYRGQELIVGYDKRRDILVTAIPTRKYAAKSGNATQKR